MRDVQQRWRRVGALVVMASALGSFRVSAEWEKGMAALQAGRFETAEREFREVVETHPKYAPGYYRLGSAQLSLKKSSEAIAALRRAVELDATSATYAYSLAQAQLSSGRGDLALEALEPHEPSTLPDSLKARYVRVLAAAAHKNTKPEQALDLLERAAEAVPGEASVWLALGKARSAASDLGGSFLAYQKAFEIDPQDVTAGRLAVRQAWAAARAEAASDSRDWYRQGGAVAEQLARQDPDPNFARLAGDSYLQAQDFSTARQWLERARAGSPEEGAVAISLARCSLELGESERALLELERAAEIARMTGDSEALGQALRLQGFAHHKTGGYREAAKAYRQAGDEAKAVEMEGYQRAADSNGEIERKRRECREKKKLVDRELREKEASKGLFSTEEWQKIEQGFARRLKECQPFLDEAGPS